MKRGENRLNKRKEENIMARIDTSKIEGYEGMTPEEKIAALEAVEFDDHASEAAKNKAALDKANSEAADWKRKYKEQLSAEEQKKQAESEEMAALREQVESMKRERTLLDHKTQLMSIGYDEALAADTAQALVSGDAAKFFANQKVFLEGHDRAYKQQLMGGLTPPAGGSVGTKTEIDYAKQIAEAVASGDNLKAATLTRLQEQAKNNNQ